MTFGKPDAGKPPVRFDEGRGWDRKLTTAVGLTPLSQLHLLYLGELRERSFPAGFLWADRPCALGWVAEQSVGGRSFPKIGLDRFWPAVPP